MRSKSRTVLRYLAAFAALVAGLGGGRLARAQSAWTRHPQHHDARPKPPGVPVDYVFTHNGFMHPSCVTYVQPDEVLGADFVIRAFDGTVRERVSPCPYPRYDFNGNVIAERGPMRHAGKGGGSGGYDGWLEYYDCSSPIASGMSLSTEWIVPTPPANVTSQDIALFNGFQSSDAIVQPVLDFGEEEHWAMESEVQYGQNGDVQSKLVEVNPGDTLLGTVTPSKCSSKGVCTWTITLKDLTTGQATTQTTMAVTGPVDDVVPAVLETYGVDSCDQLPASGEVPFFQNSVTDPSGAVQSIAYSFTSESRAHANPKVPANCGWNGNSSGNSFTLVFGTNATAPAGPDAGAIGSSDGDGGSSSDEGGSAGSSGGGAGNGFDAGGGSDGSSSGGGTSSGGSGGSISSSGSSGFGGSASGTAGDPGGNVGSTGGGFGGSSGGGSGGSGGSVVSDDGGAEGPSNGFTGGSSDGCGCGMVGLRSSDVGLVSGIGLVFALAGRRRLSRKRSPRRSRA